MKDLFYFNSGEKEVIFEGLKKVACEEAKFKYSVKIYVLPTFFMTNLQDDITKGDTSSMVIL